MNGDDVGRLVPTVFLVLVLLGSGAVVLLPHRTAMWLGRAPRDIAPRALLLWRILATIVFVGSVITFATGHWPRLK